MKILVDADACPKPIKEILFRAADKRKLECILVANQTIYCPPSDYIRTIRVSKGFDVADERIVELTEKGDLVITSDIPLANDAINKGAVVITPYGKKYTVANIGEALAMRDFFNCMRDIGKIESTTKSFSRKASRSFSALLDQWLCQ